MTSIAQTLEKLKRSRFRSSFHLNSDDIAYIDEKGMELIRQHAADFVRQKLAPAHPVNDGKQTPMRGHPVFKAQHGCACCCRGCLKRWYKVPQGVELTEQQQEKIVNLLMAWISDEYRKHGE